jgi:hypothetical protein
MGPVDVTDPTYTQPVLDLMFVRTQSPICRSDRAYREGMILKTYDLLIFCGTNTTEVCITAFLWIK